MKIRLIRNATLKLDYAGRTILIDPYFAPRHSLPSYTGKSKNPLVELRLPVDEILSGVDLVIISHLHSDHFDSVAKERVPKTLPILCQPGDEEKIRAAGFADVTPLTDDITWNGITITRREGSHGLGPVQEAMGSVMGISVEAVGEPHLYWLGDTVLYPPVLEVIERTQPDVIVSHSCGAYWGKDLIVMDAAETVALCEAAPFATVIATHMEALDHATVSRSDLRAAADDAAIAPSRMIIPADGEEIILTAAR
ncbi:MBL fold metallo-hydrolase [Rhizobium oryzicola]|uniref:MBL fold metallo-hydrolase n=1 Tax=Rhizobium oryzicola TaxID=1232668 RepID=A0ABT8SU82_9HYPH|nr:MBL fold metallo-hydrolase [Rhizobium oryzicola]MDO1581985.1 MBL fold metallo-hydrolase [Rhizobium oryzicola]